MIQSYSNSINKPSNYLQEASTLLMTYIYIYIHTSLDVIPPHTTIFNHNNTWYSQIHFNDLKQRFFYFKLKNDESANVIQSCLLSFLQNICSFLAFYSQPTALWPCLSASCACSVLALRILRAITLYLIGICLSG